MKKCFYLLGIFCFLFSSFAFSQSGCYIGPASGLPFNNPGNTLYTQLARVAIPGAAPDHSFVYDEKYFPIIDDCLIVNSNDLCRVRHGGGNGNLRSGFMASIDSYACPIDGYVGVLLLVMGAVVWIRFTNTLKFKGF